MQISVLFNFVLGILLMRLILDKQQKHMTLFPTRALQQIALNHPSIKLVYALNVKYVITDLVVLPHL